MWTSWTGLQRAGGGEGGTKAKGGAKAKGKGAWTTWT